MLNIFASQGILLKADSVSFLCLYLVSEQSWFHRFGLLHWGGLCQPRIWSCKAARLKLACLKVAAHSALHHD